MTQAPRVRAAVLTVSDAGARGERPDESGAAAAERIGTLPAAVVARRIVPDDAPAIRSAVVALAADADLLVLTGGTGLGPRDVTPQTVQALLEYEIPGMAEAMRARGLTHTPHAMLSRQLAGVRDRCLVLALPGSPAAVQDGLDAVWPSLPHALRVIGGAGGDGHAAGDGPVAVA